MHENAPVLTAKKRERVGSKYAARVRKSGGLPAIVYGHGQEPLPVAIEAHEALKHIMKGEKVFSLDVDGKKEFVLLKDIGYDYLGTNVVHIDLARVDLNERVNTHVHIKLVGEPVGLKTAGTVLMHPVTEITINCLVTNLPDVIEVDIRDLGLGGIIHASDVKLPKDTMKLVSDPHGIIAQIVVTGAGESAAAEAAEVASSAQPEVIKKEKKDEEKA